MNKIILAYCIENQSVAAKIASSLIGKVEIEKVVFDFQNGIKSLEKCAKDNSHKVLLLISDNLLKSENCMNNALGIIQNLGNQKRLIPITTEGVYSQGSNEGFLNIPTSFDRVSNVIQYMNHWQDRYLELRRKKPDTANDNEFNENVRVVRTISSEIGELLRYMRAMEYYSFDQFEESNFIILHRVLGLPVTAEMENGKKIAVSHTIFPSSPSEVIDKVSVEKPVEIIKFEEKIPEYELEIGNVNGRPNYEIAENLTPKVEPKPMPEPIVEQPKFYDEAFADALINQGLDRPSTLEALIEGIKNESQNNFTQTQNPPKQPSQFDRILNEIVEEDNIKADKIVDEPKAVLQPVQHVFSDLELDPELSLMEKLHQNPKVESVKIEETKPVETVKSVEETKPILEKTEEPLFAFEADENTQVIDKQGVTNDDLTPNTEGVAEMNSLNQAKLALSKEPLDNGLRYNYASELAQNNRFQDAIEELEMLTENDRTNPEVYILMAYCAEQSGDYLLSLSCLEKVTLIKPDFPGIFYKLGTIVNEHFKNQKRKAYRYFKEAIQRDPSNADAHFQLGMLEMEQSGDIEATKLHFENAIAQNPNHGQANFELAKMYYETGDKMKAAQYYAVSTAVNVAFKTKINDDIFKYEEPAPPAPEVNDNGKVVLITGASSGIGRATAEIFAKNGYRLVLTGRRYDKLEEVKTEFETEFKNKIQLLNFDVRSVDSVKKALESLEEDFKNVDVLINNAGLASGLSPIHEGDINDWELMIDTNIKGLLYMTRAVAPHMVARKKGHIINLSSVAGKEVYPNGNVYSATKAAVEALTKAMRIDLHKHNVRVSQVAPGAVEETEFALVRFHGDAEKAKIYEDFQPLKASDVAETIYFMVTRPEYVNIQDVVMMGTQQANTTIFDRSGRKDKAEIAE